MSNVKCRFLYKTMILQITCNRSSRSPDPSLPPLLTYVGAIYSLCFLLALQFLLIGFVSCLQVDLCWIGELTMKHGQKSDWKLDLPWFSYGYWKCMYVDSLFESISRPPNPSLNYERMQVFFGLFFLALHFLLIRFKSSSLC